MSNTLRQPRAIFWDMDGTLIDTEPLWGIATYELSERLGRRITPEVRARTMGGSFPATLRILSEWAGISLDDDASLAHYRWMVGRMQELFAEGIAPNPGIVSLLESLASRGTPMYVTTNTVRELADPCIDAVGRRYFVDSVCGDEVENPKPAPDMYLEAVRRTGAEPGECLVFEDSWNGMSAAAAAGCVVLGLAPDVPDGVQKFDPAALVGAGAADVDRWFTQSR